MAIGTGAGGELPICPACGYPTLVVGLCAACAPSAASVAYLTINASDSASDFPPAA
jgi:hypothetical protein